MKKFLENYGVIILLYFVIVMGILFLNSRCKLLNQTVENSNNYSFVVSR